MVFTDVERVQSQFVGKNRLLDDVANHLTGGLGGSVEFVVHVPERVESEEQFCRVCHGFFRCGH